MSQLWVPVLPVGWSSVVGVGVGVVAYFGVNYMFSACRLCRTRDASAVNYENKWTKYSLNNAANNPDWALAVDIH